MEVVCGSLGFQSSKMFVKKASEFLFSNHMILFYLQQFVPFLALKNIKIYVFRMIHQFLIVLTLKTTNVIHFLNEESEGKNF